MSPINFDSLPQEKPEGTGSFGLIPEGQHLLTIESTSIKTSGVGNKYLEVVFKVEGHGKLWDRIMPSDKAAMQYKLARFIRACGIPLSGEMELDDLAKVVVGKSMYGDIKHTTETYKDKEQTKAEINIFASDIYYTVDEVLAAKNETLTDTAPDENPPTTATGSY